jgi:hypothetical protein
VKTWFQNVLSNATCAATHWSLFYPIDVIKSALMTDAVNPKERQYKAGLYDWNAVDTNTWLKQSTWLEAWLAPGC